MSKVPSVNVQFRAAPQALDAPARVLVIAAIGSTGTATPGEVNKVVNTADLAALFGDSEINDAARAWFDEGLQADFDLYAQGMDASSWVAETWQVLFTGTAGEAGTEVLRFGEYTVPVTVAKDDDGDAMAIAAAAALTASQAPLTAVVDATTTNQVNIASAYKGAHTQRFPLSVNLYRDRGELGVDGVTVAITPQATGAGDPTFSAPAEDYDFVLHPFRATAFLDALEAHLESGWTDRNAFAHSIVPIAGGQSSVTTFGDARNDRHASYPAISDAPIFELSAAVRVLAAVRDAIAAEGTPNISGQRLPVPIPAFTVPLDAEALLDAGVTPLRVNRTTVTTVRLVASYREDDQGAEDLSQFDLGTVLGLAEFGNRLVALFNAALGKAIVADGTPLNPLVAQNALSPGQLTGQVRELLKGAWRDAIVFAESEEVLASAITSVTITEDNGRATGFALQLDPMLVRRIVFLKALVRYL